MERVVCCFFVFSIFVDPKKTLLFFSKQTSIATEKLIQNLDLSGIIVLFTLGLSLLFSF